MGRLASKSIYMVLLFSCGRSISWSVFSRKLAGNEHSEALASASISSSTPLTSARTPTFSINSAWLGVSNTILAGWKAIGLWNVS
jgi:hypothetical protein